jgi:membrane protein DedA with SNARE-associated domain
MSFARFLLAIFFGRMVRFGVLAVLVIKFGPDVVRLTGELVRQHYYVVLAIVGLGVAAWLVRRSLARKKESKRVNSGRP